MDGMQRAVPNQDGREAETFAHSQDGRRVVVTGAAGGIGRAIAERMIAAGAQVVINDLDPVRTAAVATEIGAHPLAGDAASQEGSASLVSAARAHLGHIDVWFANAGILRGHDIDATEDDWSACWNVNTMAHVRAAQLLLPDWLERGVGRFVLTASAAGLLTQLGAAPYSVTKHAALAFAEWLSITYRHRGIVVQAICPQGVQTEMLDLAGPARDVVAGDGALTPAQVAEVVWDALNHDRFLVLPHPEVASYFRNRATDTDRWHRSMNRLQQRVETLAAREPAQRLGLVR